MKCSCSVRYWYILHRWSSLSFGHHILRIQSTGRVWKRGLKISRWLENITHAEVLMRKYYSGRNTEGSKDALSLDQTWSQTWHLQENLKRKSINSSQYLEKKEAFIYILEIKIHFLLSILSLKEKVKCSHMYIKFK